MDINKFKIFKCVSDIGRISDAASVLGVRASTISMSIASMESELGHKLFSRHYRGVKLTPEGEKLYNSVSKILDEYSFALESISSEYSEEIEGVLRVSTTFGTASSNWFLEKLKEFNDKFPKLKIKIIDYKEDAVDLLSADIFICPYIYDHLDLIQEEIKEVVFKLFSSKDYIKRFGLPKEPKDLDKHQLITLSRSSENAFNDVDMLLHAGSNNQTRYISLETNNSSALSKMVQQGFGISVLPDYPEVRESLINVLPELEIKKQTFIVYKKKQRDIKKISAFTSLFLEK